MNPNTVAISVTTTDTNIQSKVIPNVTQICGINGICFFFHIISFIFSRIAFINTGVAKIIAIVNITDAITISGEVLKSFNNILPHVCCKKIKNANDPAIIYNDTDIDNANLNTFSLMMFYFLIPYKLEKYLVDNYNQI